MLILMVLSELVLDPKCWFIINVPSDSVLFWGLNIKCIYVAQRKITINLFLIREKSF